MRSIFTNHVVESSLRARFLFVLAVLLPLCVLKAQIHTNTQRQLEEIDAIFTRLSERNAYVEDLNFGEEDAIHLPLGMKRTVGGMEVTIAINRFALNASSTELGVYAKAVIPQGEEGKRRVLFFGAEGIKGTHTGGLIGEIKLSLLHDVEIPFNNGNTKFVLKGGPLSKGGGLSQSQTFMTIGCEGPRTLSLDAEVHFPTSLMTSVTDGGQVIGRFSTVVDSWDDLLVSMTLPNFELKGLKGYVFSLDNVVLDFSSTRNAEHIRFPEIYEQGYLPDERTLWRGVYADNVSITLPKSFSNAKISAKGLLIDDQGVTGVFAVDSLLALERGSADGWRFSVDHFDFRLIASELERVAFNGRLGLPFRGDRTTLAYEGLLLADNEYSLKVATAEKLDFSIFKAEAVLEPNSRVILRLIDDHFVPEAILHGYMTLGKGEAQVSDDTHVALDKIKFRNLKLTTKAPYISAEYFGYEGEARLGNFPLSIHKLGLNNADSQHVRLSVGAGITLGQNLFSGQTELGLLARYDGSAWLFDKLEIGSIALDATIAGSMHLKGDLNWYREDAIYGNGFAGDISLGISFSGKIKSKADYDVSIQTRGAFGRKEGHRYWYADGMATFKPGIPIVGPMVLNGIGGALTSGVRADGRDPNGGRFTNARYVPDATMGLGFKASTIFEISKVAYGEAAFEMNFSRSGGLASAGFYGYGEFPNKGGDGTPAKERLEKQNRTFPSNLSEQLKQNDLEHLFSSLGSIPNAIKDIGISGTLAMQMDFQNRTLHATTNVYVNTPTGIIRGLGDRGRAGWGVLHISPSEWYLHMGTPVDRLGLQLNVGNILAVRSGSYLMAGSRIPEMPAPPQAVADLLGEDLSKLRIGRNLEALSTGKGFAFGSDLSVKTGDIQFAIMYANFNAGLGFDVMLKDYGAIQCCGRSGPIGLDGWYAQGQTYAYLHGELGVKVKLWFLRMRIPVIRGGAAALLQAALPDPTFFRGYLGVHLNVLGLIKGKARFKLTIGDECDPVIPGDSPVDEPMINDLSPSAGENQVSVFSMPHATFNVAMGKSFEAMDNAGNTSSFRIDLQDFILRDKEGKHIEGKLFWNKERTDVRFQAKEILPPNMELTAEVRVGFEELKNGVWTPVLTSGKPAVEERIHHFVTGGAPNDIPMQNILYTYPIVSQKYYLTEESRKGYVQLQFGQRYLFEKGFEYKLSFTSEDGVQLPVDFRYNEGDNRLEFALPSLKKQASYALNLSYKAKSDNIGGNDLDVPHKQETDDFVGHIGGRKAHASVSSELEHSILSYDFSTSRYPTFRDKMRGVKIKDALAMDAGSTFSLGMMVQAEEAFDQAEVVGVDKSASRSLLVPHAVLQEDYFTKDVLPLVYGGYPYGSVVLDREVDLLGIPPHKALSPSLVYLTLLANERLGMRFPFPLTFDVSLMTFRDYNELQSKVLNSPALLGTDVYRRFALRSLPIFKYGKYKVVIGYMLPDGTLSSQYDFYYTNPLKLNL